MLPARWRPDHCLPACQPLYRLARQPPFKHTNTRTAALESPVIVVADSHERIIELSLSFDRAVLMRLPQPWNCSIVR